MFIGDIRKIRVYIIFIFLGRMEKYFVYKWILSDFNGVDFDDILK